MPGVRGAGRGQLGSFAAALPGLRAGSLPELGRRSSSGRRPRWPGAKVVGFVKGVGRPSRATLQSTRQRRRPPNTGRRRGAEEKEAWSLSSMRYGLGTRGGRRMRIRTFALILLQLVHPAKRDRYSSQMRTRWRSEPISPVGAPSSRACWFFDDLRLQETSCEVSAAGLAGT